MNDPQAAAELAGQAVVMSRAIGSEGRSTLLKTLRNLAWLTTADLGDPDRSVALFEEVEAIWRGLADEAGDARFEEEVRAGFACHRALLANWQRRYNDATAHAAELIQFGEQRGDLLCLAGGHTFGGIACLGLGEYPAAREHIRLALKLNRQMQGWEIAYNLRWLAAVDLAEGNLERAHACCRESLAEADSNADRNIIASNLGLLANLYAKADQPELAARLAGASAALYARQKRKPWEDASLDTLLPSWQVRSNSAEISGIYELGRGLSSDEALAYALSLKLLEHTETG